MTLDQLYGQLPFAVQCKLYNHQPLSEAEQARYATVLKSIAEAEERQYQEIRATFAQYCKIDATK